MKKGDVIDKSDPALTWTPGLRVASHTTGRAGQVIHYHEKDDLVQVRWGGDSLTYPVHPENLYVLPPVEKAPVSAGINPKDIIGATKPDIALVPPTALIHFAKAMENGAGKYGAYNWRTKAVGVMTYLAAAQRHILQYLDGEDFAQDSGVHHLAHAGACLAIVLDAIETGNLVDNRPPQGAASRLISDLTEGSK